MCTSLGISAFLSLHYLSHWSNNCCQSEIYKHTYRYLQAQQTHPSHTQKFAMKFHKEAWIECTSQNSFLGTTDSPFMPRTEWDVLWDFSPTQTKKKKLALNCGSYSTFKRYNSSFVVDLRLAVSKLQEMVKDREAWRAAVHGVATSRTRPSNWTTRITLSSVSFH